MDNEKTTIKAPKIPTKARLKNIALYYLERFETSQENLRTVLKRRIDKYAFFDKSYKKEQAYIWVDEIVNECVKFNFVNDDRFALFKIDSYLNAGKPKRYIEQKLKAKGIDENTINNIFDNIEYSEYDVALHFAKKKRIGRFRQSDDDRANYYKKDLATLVRAGFSYDIAKEILNTDD